MKATRQNMNMIFLLTMPFTLLILQTFLFFYRQLLQSASVMDGALPGYTLCTFH